MVTNVGTYDLFDAIYPEYKTTKPVRLIEFFGGIGSQAKALERLGVDFETWRLCEIDKFAVESYNAIHGTNFITSDITQTHAQDLSVVSPETYDYILTWSVPCQSLSVAGLRKGMSEGSGTTSSLIWEVRRILKEMYDLKTSGEKDAQGLLYGMPKILLMENVPQVIDAKNVGDLNKMRDFLESVGYSNYLAILKGNDYGVPQARHRAFMVSILGDDENPVYSYQFPLPCGCLWNMQDCLWDDFDSKHFIKDSVAHSVCEENAAFNRNVDHKINAIKLCGRLNAHQAGGVFDPTGVSPTLTAGGSSALLVLQRNVSDLSDSQDWNSFYWMGPSPDVDVTVPETSEETADYLFDDSTEEPDYTKEPDYSWVPVVRDHKEFLIRTLTPKETLQIMDFDEEDFKKATLVTSNHQLHKQAGNSIVVNCIVALLGRFFPGKEKVYLDVAKCAPKDRTMFGKPI